VRRLLLLLLPALAAMAEGAPRRSAASKARPSTKKAAPSKQASTAGAVTWVGAEFAFVNRGTAEGVAVGQQLLLSRGGRSAGTCAVQAAAEHSARCTGTNLRVGDLFTSTPPRAEASAGPPPLPTEAELRRQQRLVEATPWTLRAFDGAGSGLGAGLRAEAALSHTTFFNQASTRGPTGQQRVDVVVSDLELYRGLRASADLTVLNFSQRPDATRTLYTQTPVLLVRQLELGFRRADVPIAAALGRTWLSTGAGLLVLDGAHASYKVGGVEVGAFAGLLPDGARLTPSLSQSSAGAFARAQLASGEGAASSVVQLSGRAGYAVRDAVGSRFEAAVSAGLWSGRRFDAHASVELGLGQSQAPGGIDAARVDVGWRPLEKLHLMASGRYRGLPVSGLTEVGLVSPGLRALHGDVFGSWEVTPGLLVGLRAGVATDFLSALTQLRGGPEVLAPSLFGGPVSLGAGYSEELGWLRGRSAWFSFGVSAGSVFRVVSRTNLFQQQATAEAAGLSGSELGQSLAIEVAPWRFLRARVVVMGRQTTGERFAPFGSLGAQVSGAF